MGEQENIARHNQSVLDRLRGLPAVSADPNAAKDPRDPNLTLLQDNEPVAVPISPARQ